jgi:hypothetical protein
LVAAALAWWPCGPPEGPRRAADGQMAASGDQTLRRRVIKVLRLGVGRASHDLSPSRGDSFHRRATTCCTSGNATPASYLPASVISRLRSDVAGHSPIGTGPALKLIFRALPRTARQQVPAGPAQDGHLKPPPDRTPIGSLRRHRRWWRVGEPPV